ncbi:MAG: DUF3127 domain-containing protein [Prevotella sp.]|nr:DUF3127 domain-containing protein [Candidatus Equicola stercoris]
MRRIGKIVAIGNKREGLSQTTGERWMRQEVVVSWDEQVQNAEPCPTSIVMEVKKELNEQRVQTAIASGESVEFSFFMTARPYEGRYYNNITGFLPREFYE